MRRIEGGLQEKWVIWSQNEDGHIRITPKYRIGDVIFDGSLGQPIIEEPRVRGRDDLKLVSEGPPFRYEELNDPDHRQKPVESLRADLGPCTHFNVAPPASGAVAAAAAAFAAGGAGGGAAAAASASVAEKVSSSKDAKEKKFDPFA